MTIPNAIGFLGLGLLMLLAPSTMPAWFPPGGFDGANTSALWLEVMGAVNHLLGAGFIARKIPATMARLWAWRPAVVPPAQLARVLRPALAPSAQAIYADLEEKAGRHLAA